MDIELRPVAPDELTAFVEATARGFGGYADDTDMQRGRTILELERTLAAFHEGAVVGTAASYSYQVTVPGAVLPVAGVAWVAVQPTHRRRGILRRMMERQLQDVRQRGESIAVLTASESSIYGRFGYGIGTLHEQWSIERHHAALAHHRPQHGTVRFVSKDEARRMFPPIYQRACGQRSGMIARNDTWWDVRMDDPEGYRRRGMTAFFHIVYERGGLADGYALYRLDHARRKVFVEEEIAATDEAHAALWHFLFGIDLMDTIEGQRRPVDDPLTWMLADPRRLSRTPRDGLWLRLVDVPAALSSRRYAQQGRLVLEVADSFCPWVQGCYELEGGPDGAVCRLTSASPDLTLSPSELGAAYLGGVKFRTLAQAGRVLENTPGALARGDAMFGTALAPWCPHDF